MSFGKRFALFAGFIAGAAAVWSPASAADSARLCADIAGQKAVVAEHHGRWIELDSNQWQFLRGIYAMNPLTPPGLPYGDKAALARVDGNSGGLIFFIDGERACTPMSVPDTLLTMMDDVATARIPHEGSGL